MHKYGFPDPLAVRMRRFTDSPTDLTEDEWRRVKVVLPRQMLLSPHRRVDLRAIVNAMAYWAKTGKPMRELPPEYPKYGTVYYFMCRWGADGTLDKIYHAVGNKEMQRGLLKMSRILRRRISRAHRHNQYIQSVQDPVKEIPEVPET